MGIRETGVSRGTFTQVSRRRFLRLMGAGAGSLVVLSAGVGCNFEIEKKVSVADQIRAFENEVGDRPLTDDEMGKFLPMVAQIFTETLHSSRSTREITRNTFLIRRDFTDQEEQKRDFERVITGQNVSSSPTISQLKKDYPGLRLERQGGTCVPLCNAKGSSCLCVRWQNYACIKSS